MAKSDQFRWQGWRDLGRCRCGRAFLRLIPGQQVCEACVEGEMSAELQEIRQRAAETFGQAMDRPVTIPYQNASGTGGYLIVGPNGLVVDRVGLGRRRGSPCKRLRQCFDQFLRDGDRDALDQILRRSVGNDDDAASQLFNLCDAGEWDDASAFIWATKTVPAKPRARGRLR